MLRAVIEGRRGLTKVKVKYLQVVLRAHGSRKPSTCGATKLRDGMIFSAMLPARYKRE